MKYGLMYFRETGNLGDDIQTYAARQFLPCVDYCMDREALSCFLPEQKEPVALIMNGWFLHNKVAWPPSPYVLPLPVSMHFNGQNITTDVGDACARGLGGDWLQAHAPIGARDSTTQRLLAQNGVRSYSSGCLTLTLDRFKLRERERDLICLVDVSDAVIKKVKDSCNCRVEVLTHNLDPAQNTKKSLDARMRAVEVRLKKYQEARVVITTRLHVMLPCVALGTPVIWLHGETFDHDRFDDYCNWADHYTEADFLRRDIRGLLRNPRPNSQDYLPLRRNLEGKCRDFVAKCENGEVKTPKLPDLKKHREYVTKINYYREIYGRLWEVKEKICKRNRQEIHSRDAEIARLLGETERIRRDLEQARQELDAVYRSKGWRALTRLRKIIYRR